MNKIKCCQNCSKRRPNNIDLGNGKVDYGCSGYGGKSFYTKRCSQWIGMKK